MLLMVLVPGEWRAACLGHAAELLSSCSNML
jgi:hypothetical protein